MSDSISRSARYKCYDLSFFVLTLWTKAIDLLQKMLSFDPLSRITVHEALYHPWLATYHDETDEPECPNKFERWKDIEKLETLEEFRQAIWNEIQDYRMEGRGLKEEQVLLPQVVEEIGQPAPASKGSPVSSAEESRVTESKVPDVRPLRQVKNTERVTEGMPDTVTGTAGPSGAPAPADPVVSYSRRPSVLQPTRRSSVYSSPPGPTPQHPWPGNIEGLPPNSTGVPFPGQMYVVPARSRAPSTVGDVGARNILRTLSTVSIHESAEGLPGGLAAVAPIGKYIVGQKSEADAPPSEIPKDFGVEEGKETR